MDPYIGNIIIFSGTFAPRGWAFCEGQILAIANHQALFSILGTSFGGDGRTTFGLPDLRGRAAVSSGQGPGLSNYPLGTKTGAEYTSLVSSNLPAAIVAIPASSEDANSDEPGGKGAAVTSDKIYASTADELMAPGSIAGAVSQPFNNRQPYIGTNYIIALEGLYPSRN